MSTYEPAFTFTEEERAAQERALKKQKRRNAVAAGFVEPNKAERAALRKAEDKKRGWTVRHRGYRQDRDDRLTPEPLILMVLAVDPGANGGWVLIESGQPHPLLVAAGDLARIPTPGGGRGGCLVVLERQTGMRPAKTKDGRDRHTGPSEFSFGSQYGAIRERLDALAISHELPMIEMGSHVWRRLMPGWQKVGAKAAAKAWVLRNYGIRLGGDGYQRKMPALLCGPQGGYQDGRGDALVMATCAAQMLPEIIAGIRRVSP